MTNNLWKPVTVAIVLTLVVSGLAMLLAGCGPEEAKATPTPVLVRPTATSVSAAPPTDTPTPAAAPPTDTPVPPQAEPAPPPTETEEAAGLIDNFEGGDFDDRWRAYTDEGTISFTCTLDQPGHAGAQAMRLTFEVGADGWPICIINVDPEQWGDAGGLSFFWRADQPDLAMSVVLEMEDPTQANPDAQGVTPFQAELQTPGEEWLSVTLAWDDFAKAEWVGESGVNTLDPRRVVALFFEVSEKQSGSVWVDDLQLMTGLVAKPAPPLPPADTPASKTEEPVPPTATPGVEAPAQEAVYYVAPTGDDANPGTEAQPWRTIQHAAETLVAGDTVYIMAGTYAERVNPQNSGSAGNYIVYAAYPGATVTIDGSGVTLPDDLAGLFEVSDKSYIKISGLRVINAGSYLNNAGILVSNSSYIVIEKNYTHNTVSSGIGVWGSNNVIIDGNEVVLACNDGGQENITVAGTNIFEVKNNHVHDGGPGTNGGEGIDAKDGSSNGKIYGNHVHHNRRLGIYVDAWDKHTYNIEVFQNVVHDVTDNNGFVVASEAGGLLENVNIYNNVVYNSKFVGIALSRNGDSPAHPMNDIRVINNTVYNNGRGEWGGGILVDNPDAQDVVIRNNIVSQNLSFQIAAEVTPVGPLTVDHNLIDGYREYVGETRGSDYVEGDPMFVDPAGADFHLRENSPSIDAGFPADAPADDFEGEPRPQEAGYDMGADEY